MSKFNINTNTNTTTNLCGKKAYKLSNEMLLASKVMTSFIEDKFYKGSADELSELIDLSKKVPADFLAKLIVYTRATMNMRSVTHLLIAILANRSDGKEFVRKVCSKAILRVDDMTEIMACSINLFGKPIPNSLKKGINDALNRFDEFQLAKYNRQGAVKLKDLLMICHPKAKSEEQNILFKKILDDKLDTPYTWEVELSAKGNTKEVWEELISSKQVGYMALLRNLSNIIQAQPSNLAEVHNFLRSKEAVLKSKQLPFRFYSAYKTLLSKDLLSSKIADTLEIAISASVENIAKLNGKTLIAIDESGSMSMLASKNSSITCYEIGRVLGSIASSICEDSEIIAFDTELKKLVFPSTNGIISNALQGEAMGGGTNVSLVPSYALDNNKFFDRIIILSDNQCNSRYGNHDTQALLDKYRNKINPNVLVYMIDMCGYGTSQINPLQPKQCYLASWSEKIFDFITMFENGAYTFIESINKLEL